MYNFYLFYYVHNLINLLVVLFMSSRCIVPYCDHGLLNTLYTFHIFLEVLLNKNMFLNMILKNYMRNNIRDNIRGNFRQSEGPSRKTTRRKDRVEKRLIR